MLPYVTTLELARKFLRYLLRASRVSSIFLLRRRGTSRKCLRSGPAEDRATGVWLQKGDGGAIVHHQNQDQRFVRHLSFLVNRSFPVIQSQRARHRDQSLIILP